jgi:proline-specific peptidase
MNQENAGQQDFSGYVEVEGGKLWYRCVGTGPGVPLIVIHGGPGASHVSLLSLAALADERPIIFYDQLDSGNSERTADSRFWTVERFVSEVESLRQSLEFSEYAILGHSWGGTIAAEVAIHQPRELRACILASPLLSTSQWVVDNDAYVDQLPAQHRLALKPASPADSNDAVAVGQAVEAFYKRYYCRLDPWPEELVRTAETMNLDLYNYMWGDNEFRPTGTLLNYDVTGRLSRVQCPTLFTCGEFDEAAPATIRRLASLVANAQYKSFAGASHNPHFEARADYLSAVREFLSKFD